MYEDPRRSSSAEAATIGGHRRDPEDPAVIRDQLGSGIPLELSVRALMEAGLGQQLPAVRVHTDARAANLAASMSARAITVGRDVAFGRDQYRPGTLVGDAILAHELAHTLQQREDGAQRVASGASLERDADAATMAVLTGNRGVRPAAGAGLRLQRCNGDGGKDKEAKDASVQVPPTTASGTSTAPAPPVPSAPTATAVSSVKSLEVEALKKKIQGDWSLVTRKSQQRDAQLTGAAGLVTGGSAAEGTVKRMQGRLSSLQASIADSSFVPEKSGTPWSSSIATELAAEQADAESLKHKFKFLPGSISQLASAVEAFLSDRRMLGEEQTEFARFDQSFAVADAVTLLKAMTPAIFDAADVKALMAQESSDFTNVLLKGLGTKTKGIVRRHRNPAVVGAAQFKKGALKDAIGWASSKGVTIATTPDPREDVAKSILLATAYIGWNLDRMNAGLPAPRPSGIELKKMTFAAYNGGFANVIAAAKAMAGKPYAWDDIKNQPSVTGQMRDYVARIFERL
jgi:hypothetical protein